jgi:hypothetical protein
MLAVSLTTVRGWENGSRPLYCVRYDQLRRLAEALRQAGAHVGQETSELVLASQCDLLIAGILRGFRLSAHAGRPHSGRGAASRLSRVMEPAASSRPADATRPVGGTVAWLAVRGGRAPGEGLPATGMR